MRSSHWLHAGAMVAAVASICAGHGAAGAPPSASAQAANVAWVDDDGVQAKAFHIKNAFKAIPDAIHAVGPGGVVRVLPGLYNSGGTISVENGKSLIAMRDRTHPVNPRIDPANTNWPVIIENDTGNAIESFGGQQNITIQGFYIRRAAANGIQVQGVSVPTYGVDANGVKILLSVDITSRCSNVYIIGNRIENTYLDGLKIDTCSDVHVIGNEIRYTSTIINTIGAREQAIDFLLTANSEVRGNLVLDNVIGMTVKGGSVGMTVTGNTFSGPFLWVALSGEPVNNRLSYSSATSPQPWGVKDLVVTGNVLDGANADVAVDGCQSCTYANNTLGGGGYLIVPDSMAVTKALCIEDAAPIRDNTGGVVVATSNCPTTFPPALIVPGMPRGIDIQPAN